MEGVHELPQGVSVHVLTAIPEYAVEPFFQSTPSLSLRTLCLLSQWGLPGFTVTDEQEGWAEGRCLGYTRTQGRGSPCCPIESRGRLRSLLPVRTPFRSRKRAGGVLYSSQLWTLSTSAVLPLSECVEGQEQIL